MTRLLAGRLQFFPGGQGGRSAGPPAGPLYFPNLAPAYVELDEAFRPEHYFSAKIELGVLGEDGWTFANVETLVPGGPGDVLLVPGAEFHLMEGPNVVGRLVLDRV